MDLKKLNSGQNVIAYLTLTNSSAMEIKGKIRGINDGRVAIDFIDDKGASQTVEVRPVDVMEIL